jgi:L1 cell adhesion molecule like protein
LWKTGIANSALTACFKLLYKESSVSEKGTLNQLKVMLNHKRVTFPNHKITNFDACDDFFGIVLSSHVTAAAMELLNMTNLEDEPRNESTFPAEGWLEDSETKKDLLYSFSSKIVSKFIDIDASFIVQTSLDDNDRVLSYSKLLMSVGMVYKEYCDAIREGDGLRVLSCWRYMWLFFKVAGWTNYSIEALNLLAQYHFLLSNRQKHQLLWGRFINVHGLPARNIPCDLFMEHLNRVCKEAVSGLGSNKTEKALVHVSKTVGAIDDVLNNFDQDNNINERSGSHKMASFSKYLTKVVRLLLIEKVFKCIPGRRHNSFQKIVSNPIAYIDFEHLIDWMYQNLKFLIHGF